MASQTPGGVEQRAVSPVIAVVLLVAITVVLATVVGALSVSIDDQNGEQATAAGISPEFDQRTDGNGQYLNLTYAAGEALETSRLEIRVRDARSADPAGSTEDAEYTGSVLSAQAGPTLTVGETVSLDRTDFREADGDPITGGEFLDLTDATVTIYRTSPDSSTPIYEWTP